MVEKRRLGLAVAAGLLALSGLHAIAESDAITHEVPVVVEEPPQEPAEPLDLVPHGLPDTATPAGSLKQVKVPMPPQITRSGDAAQQAATETPSAAGPALSTANTTPSPPTADDLQTPEPPKPDLAPKTASLPSFVLEPSRNPAIPPAGAAAAPAMQAPPGVKGNEDEEEESHAPAQSGVETQTDIVDVRCLKPELLDLIRQTGNFFHQIPVITSGYRARGRPGSYHRRCMAADFIVPGVSQQQLVAFLRHLPGAGGVGTYCQTKAVHLDIGEPRDWGYCGFRRTYFSMR